MKPMMSRLNIVMMTTMPEVTLGHSVTGRGRDSALARHILIDPVGHYTGTKTSTNQQEAAGQISPLIFWYLRT